MSDIKPGKYTAHAISGFFKEPEGKSPYVEVTYEFNDNGVKKTIPWRGYLSEKAEKRTWAALALSGYNDSLGVAPDGTIPAEFFNRNSEVQITIADEPWTTDKGEVKSSMKVQWVNPLGGAQFSGLGQKEVTALFQRLDIKAKMAEARADQGLKTPDTGGLKQKPPNRAPQTPPKIDTSDEIPF